MNRDRLRFEYYFNAGINRITGTVDEEGCDVFELDDSGSPHYIGSIPWAHPMAVSGMNDAELEQLLAQNGIFPNLV